MDYVNFVFSSILNFQNADIEPSKTCWGELRDESEEELTLLLGADFPDSEYPRSRVDQSGSHYTLYNVLCPNAYNVFMVDLSAIGNIVTLSNM